MNRLRYKTMSLGERVRDRMKVLGLEPKDIMKATGASKGTVSQWMNDGTSPNADYLVQLCNVLKVTADYLVLGIPDDIQGDNVVSIQYARGLVPVISKVQAGSWRQESDEFQPGDADEYLPCPRTHSKHTYALRVEGDSMTSPAGKSYPNGTVVYCDPEQAAGVVSGDPVIAKIKGEDEVTFKLYVQDGSRKFLKPLNSSYPAITDEFKVLAKVIGAWVDS